MRSITGTMRSITGTQGSGQHRPMGCISKKRKTQVYGKHRSRLYRSPAAAGSQRRHKHWRSHKNGDSNIHRSSLTLRCGRVVVMHALVRGFIRRWAASAARFYKQAYNRRKHRRNIAYSPICTHVYGSHISISLSVRTCTADLSAYMYICTHVYPSG